ncbi:ATP-dependent DNA helicase RecG [Candidatus Tisiphia endosymbiont of Nemotelus uliginosus]|uniref:ATP-dependent DNA helicase RecG n=1 Tax=Candidatus Tisiphia endosymbiont of Nemotelus uliginosus TaxID=3077926 RepID=UPI0035C8EE6D
MATPDLNKFFFAPVKTYININDNIINALKRLEIINLRDLLFYRPISYQIKLFAPNLSSLQNDLLIQMPVTINEILIPTKKTQPLKILTSNDTGSLLLIFFHKPANFIFNQLQIGRQLTVKGKVQVFAGLPQIIHPEFIFHDRANDSIEPIYPLTYGVVSPQLYSYIKQAIILLENYCHNITMTSQYSYNYLKSLLTDIKILHYYQVTPPHNNLDKIYNKCLRRLAEQELLANQLTLNYVRTHLQKKQGNSFAKAITLQNTILSNLEFELTDDQKITIAEIEQDQLSTSEMMRLLQGDVGSGKTIVALLTMVNVVPAKFQAALMVPTDLLANQHYQFFIKALNGTAIRLALLTSRLATRDRKQILLDLHNGDIDILIGTHALFQEKVNFKKLGYIVIDEQHRFGVQQRLDLINKASSPDVLVMTATPIPRSLTLTMFGDMAISQLRNKPNNRLPIITSIVPKVKLADLMVGLDKKLKLKEKIYWICPLIDQKDKEEIEGENSREVIDINTRLASLTSIYPNITAAIHGKMRNEQKDIIMQQFQGAEIHILVATTVIEVGINIPEATLIIIENAEQFGLAQLHQIRGRVGRSHLQSHCILLYDPKRLSKTAKSRFEIMKNSNDGFYIAEQDLLLRGSGEILGTKQSGEIRFFFADLPRDNELLIQANKLAANIVTSEITTLQIKLFAKTELQELN